MPDQRQSASLTPDETALVSLAQAGDDRAFALLVAQCEPMLRAQVARFRLSRADAEDMAQEGLLGLLSAVRTYQPGGTASFRTYAAVCVRNRLLTAVRRYARRPELPVDDVSPYEGELCMPDPATLLAEQEAADSLLRRLATMLSEREYTVLLQYLDGYSYAEIADALGLSQKAVESALWRARHKVKAQIL